MERVILDLQNGCNLGVKEEVEAMRDGELDCICPVPPNYVLLQWDQVPVSGNALWSSSWSAGSLATAQTAPAGARASLLVCATFVAASSEAGVRSEEWERARRQDFYVFCILSSPPGR